MTDLTVTISGPMAAGKSVLMALIGDALASKGFNVECYEEVDVRRGGLRRSVKDMKQTFLLPEYDNRAVKIQTSQN